LAITWWEKVLAHAMQNYGMYVRDTGGSVSVFAENPVNRPSDPYVAMGITDDAPYFSSNFPWNKVRVLASC
jgi:hypothetical protein